MVDTDDEFPQWMFGGFYGADGNQAQAEQAAELLNRGHRAEREDECLE